MGFWPLWLPGWLPGRLIVTASGSDVKTSARSIEEGAVAVATKSAALRAQQEWCTASRQPRIKGRRDQREQEPQEGRLQKQPHRLGRPEVGDGQGEREEKERQRRAPAAI